MPSFLKLSCCLLFCIIRMIQVSWATTPVETGVPHYKIEVFYDAEKRTLAGNMTVRWQGEVDFGDELLFALPFNRFLAPDPRGNPKKRKIPIFVLDYATEEEDDPMFPHGFSEGSTQIHQVRSFNGTSLQYELEANPQLPIGSWQNEGILRVQQVSPSQGIKIEFETLLPKRLQEGQIEEELVTVQWHPVVMRYLNQEWEKSPFLPASAHYQVIWTSNRSGTLITSLQQYAHVDANQTIITPSTLRPLKYFPLIFSPRYQQLDRETTEISSYHFPADQEKAIRFQEWAMQYFSWVEKKYQLPLPKEKMVIVQIRGNHEEIAVLNNLILVPTPNYRRSAFLDRRVQGLFLRGVGKIWFGEQVWNDDNAQLWLSYGLPAFLGLQFYEEYYGKDARIFDFWDWFNPHFREHFYEQMSHQLPQKKQQGIMTPFEASEDPPVQMQLVTYRTALIIRMLEHLYPQVFAKVLKEFFQKFQGREATLNDFEKLFANRGLLLQWFFDQWFRDFQELDYALGEIEVDSLSNGKYHIQVPVYKIGKARMPVEVVLTTEEGERYQKIISGKLSQEVVSFFTHSPSAEVALDPEEYLLESQRLNNFSFYHFRVRLVFDYQKNREILVLLIPRVGSNAIDGNQFGFEFRSTFQDYDIRMAPGYGTKNHQSSYMLQLIRHHILEDTTFWLQHSRIEGIRSSGVSLTKNNLSFEEIELSFSLSLFHQEALQSSIEEKSKEGLLESGTLSNVHLLHQGVYPLEGMYSPRWSLELEHSVPAFGSEFEYRLFRFSFDHRFHIGFQKHLFWEWIYAGILGEETPLQKKHQLGGPQALRGFPQSTLLRDDYIWVSRIDYQFPLLSFKFWSDFSSLGIRGSLFHDRGSMWQQNTNREQAKVRENIGFGLEWTIDAFSLAKFPLKLEVGFPLNDDEYDEPRYIFFGLLSF